MMEQKYFFHLSFENSFCKDYITEKFFNVMKYNIIPGRLLRTIHCIISNRQFRNYLLLNFFPRKIRIHKICNFEVSKQSIIEKCDSKQTPLMPTLLIELQRKRKLISSMASRMRARERRSR